MTDQTLPRAEVLGLILDALRSSRGVPPEPLARFDALADRPALEVSPNGERMRPNVRAYLRSASIASLGLALRTMSERERTLALNEGSWPGVAP